MNKLLYLLLIAVCWSCSQDSETEKHQSKRDQVVDVRDKMKEFSTQDVLIGRISRTYLIDNYLIVTDYNSPDKLIHLFDKKHIRTILPAVHIRDKVRMRLQL